MSVFDKIIWLSKSIAQSLLNDENSEYLKESDVFEEEDKKYIINDLTDTQKVSERLSLKSKIDKNAGWDAVKRKINSPSVIKLYWKYAAVASAIIGISSVYFYNNQEILEVKQTSPVVSTGENKAVLTLDNGTEITLQKGNSYKNNNADSDGASIVYNKIEGNYYSASYNYLTVPRGGEFFLELSDGTQVWLNSESKLKYPTSFIEGKDREVELLFGQAYFNVSPASQNRGAAFRVFHKEQKISVLGTEFDVKAYADEENIYTTLVEGKVKVNFKANEQILIPGQQAFLKEKEGLLTVREVDVYTETSWKNGVFSFKGKSLDDIMKVLSRWYDVDIQFLIPETAKARFVGTLRKNQDLNEILLTIKNYGIIKSYEFKDDKILIK